LGRALDILASSVGLVISLPVFAVLCVILRLTGEGEIFYRQERVGRYARRFRLLKFATMLKDSPNLPGGYLTVKNDPRILPVGRVLRKTKLNELPQLWNVLKGDMSLVGPRPQAPPHYNLYPEEVKRGIWDLRPGITGIGAVLFRDEEDLLGEFGGDAVKLHDQEIAAYKGKLELWYAKHKSLTVDLKILFATLWVVIFPRSKLPWKMFRGLPEPPENLKRLGIGPERKEEPRASPISSR